VLFAALAVGWTWPLLLHLGNAVPGGPGDNYSFVWNLWWMRHVLATPHLSYFHTRYLFYPFGTTIANHPHTALPALYVVYMCFFLVVYLLASLDAVGVTWPPRVETPVTRRLRRTLMAAAVLFAMVAAWIVITGGRAVPLGRFVVSAYTPQNALTAMWIAVLGWAMCTWRPVVMLRAVPAEQVRRAAVVAAWVAAIFVAGASPLLWQAARLVAGGEYVTPAYQWRSAPRGVDLLAPLLGPPLHPLLQSAHFDAYAFTHLDRIEGIGYIGIVPVLLFLNARVWTAHVSPDLRIWRAVAAAFAVWALGPFLTVAAFDTGLKLPVILLRYVPFVANARMPGRAIVGVYMALAVIGGAAFSAAQGWLGRPAFQWLLIALLAFEFWDAPIPLTMLDRPAAYRELAAEPQGGVCEVPFGIGDGLSGGVGSQERRSLYYATVHEHPLVGGYIGRMPADTAQRYEDMPVVGALLRLSDGRPDSSGPPDVRQSACRYFVVNRPRMSGELRAYVQQLPLDLVATDEERDIYRVR
jgi:hypothetical protein